MPQPRGAWSFIAVAPGGVTFTYRLDRNRLRRARRREGRYLLRRNLTEDNPAKLLEFVPAARTS